MATLATLTTDVRNITGAEDTSVITDAVIFDLINKGQNLLGDAADLFPAYGSRNSVADQRQYILLTGSDWSKTTPAGTTGSTNLSDMIRIYRVDYDGDQMTRINMDQIYDVASDDSEVKLTTGKGYYINQTKLGIFPIPSAVKVIKVYYYRTPTTLTTSDIPEIDARYNEALIYYGCWKVAERLRDMNLIPYFKNEFKEWENKIVDDGQKRFGEPAFNIPYNDF